jgi:uncharacterized RDD family membrane protein YckC
MSTGVVFKRDDCAGFWVRLLIDLIDIVVAGIAVVVIAFPLLIILDDDVYLLRALFFLVAAVWLIYFFLLKFFTRTIGYRLGRVRLVNLQGQPPTLWEVFARALFAAIGPLNLLLATKAQGTC